MSDSHVYQLIQEFLWRALSYKHPHMLKRSAGPRGEDQECNSHGTSWVQEPDIVIFRSDNTHDETENVDNNVIAVVKHKDMSCWVSTEKEAVDKHDALCKDGNANKYERDDIERLATLGFAFSKSTAGFDEQLNGDGGHESAEEDDADCLDPLAADRKFPDVGSSSQAGGDEHYDRANKIHLYAIKLATRWRGISKITYESIGCGSEER
jgi:hypothetical protein